MSVGQRTSKQKWLVRLPPGLDQLYCVCDIANVQLDPSGDFMYIAGVTTQNKGSLGVFQKYDLRENAPKFVGQVFNGNGANLVWPGIINSDYMYFP